MSQVSRCKSRLYGVLRGAPTKGLGEASRYTSMRLYAAFFEALLGCRPHPGTFNVELDEASATTLTKLLNSRGPCLVYAPRDPRLSELHVVEALVYGVVPALIVRPRATRHPPRIAEIVACTRLADLASGSDVLVVAGCGLLRCWREWVEVVARIARLGSAAAPAGPTRA